MKMKAKLPESIKTSYQLERYIEALRLIFLQRQINKHPFAKLR